MLYERIMQTSNLTASQTVATTVLDYSETAAIFQRHRIDFCCRGHLSIEQAARERGVELAALMKSLGEAIEIRRDGAQPSPKDLSTPALIDHIVDKHHAYLRKTLPFLRPLATKVARVHGDHNPKLRELAEVVDDLTEALLPHIDEEEKILFPALRVTTGAPDPATRAQLATMVDDHLAVAALLERVHETTDDYAIPEWACGSYRTLFRELEEVERDTLAHVHLENHVLRPRFAPAPAAFDLASEAAALRASPGWAQHGRAAKTLLRTPDVRVLLLALRANTVIPEHATNHAVLVQVIAGRVQLATPTSGATELVAPAMLFMPANVAHDLVAYDDSIVLVTLDWHGTPENEELTLPVAATG